MVVPAAPARPLSRSAPRLEVVRLPDDGADQGLGPVAEAVGAAWSRGEGVWVASRDLEWLHQRLGLADRLVDGTPLVWFGPGRRGLAGRAWSRLVDLVVASLVIVLGTPLWALLAALVWASDRGTVFFGHERTGLGGRSFRLLKFRTMRASSADEEAAHRDRRRAAIAAVGEGHDPKRDDPARVTGVGRLLRRTGLDEVPQFLHVLTGRMSVVGPRPYVTWEVASFKPWHHLRFRVRPGLTGLWQVYGYHEVSFDRSVMLDLFYAANATWWLDLKLIVMTPRRMLKGLGERW